MKKLILFFLVLCYAQNVFAQNSVKVRISVPNTIANVSEKGDYISVCSLDRKENAMIAFLYDKSGKEVLKISHPRNDLILFAEYAMLHNFYLVVFMGREGEYGHEQEDDLIRAININDGSTIWEAKSNAAHYEVSPDEKYLITKMPPEFERSGPFEIINLADGCKVSINLKLNSYRATFYGNDKVLLGYNKIVKLPLDENINQERLRWRRTLTDKEQKLEDEYEKGTISKIDYEKGKDAISAEFFKRNKEYSDLLAPKYENAGINIIIYNFIEDRIENEKLITGPNGEKYILDYYDGQVGSISSDSSGNIYCHCVDYHSAEYPQNFFLRLDNMMNLQWTTKQFDKRGTAKYIIKNTPYFVISDKEKPFFIEPLSGNFTPFEVLHNQYKDIPPLTEILKTSFVTYKVTEQNRIQFTGKEVILK